MTKILYMVVPCYNEELVLDETSERLKAKYEQLISNNIISPKSRVVYVNDGSKDKTWEKIIQEQKVALATNYQNEFDFVYQKYRADGISNELAHKATDEMMKKDALATTVRERHGFTIGQELSAKGAAIASMLSFPTGALLPMLAISLIPKSWSALATFISVLIALGFTGYAAAYLNGADKKHATFRNIIAGILTMLVTYVVGLLFKQGGL